MAKIIWCPAMLEAITSNKNGSLEWVAGEMVVVWMCMSQDLDCFPLF